jgi:hypothetical protein
METETCEYCGQEIPEEEWHDHERGRDAKRLACPHQDLEEIAAAQEPDPTDWANRVW